MPANSSNDHVLGQHAAAKRLAKLLRLPDPPQPRSYESSSEVVLDGVDCCLLKADNLDALNLLIRQYSGAIDFCYIDPPYNTGSKFVYDDKRHSLGPSIWGKHAAWMGFMLPRLVLMHDLLEDTGIAAISIDDYEYAQLKVLLDHIFGSENYLGSLIVNRSKNGKGGKTHIAVNHDYVLVYGKTTKAKILGLPELALNSYTQEDEHGRYKIDGLFRKKGEASRREDRPKMHYPLYHDSHGNVFVENISGDLEEVLPIDSKGIERRWLWGIDKARNESWRLYASPRGVIYVKNYLTNEKRVKIRSLWDSSKYLTERATNEINSIYGEKIFETPKPLGLIEDLVRCCTKKNALIIDFFCGTATTAHATYNVNREDDGTRKVLLVEQKAEIDSLHIAAARGFRCISDIAERRLQFISSQDESYMYKAIDIDAT